MSCKLYCTSYKNVTLVYTVNQGSLAVLKFVSLDSYKSENSTLFFFTIDPKNIENCDLLVVTISYGSYMYEKASYRKFQ